MRMSIFSDSNTYKDVKFGYNELVKLVEESTRMSKMYFSREIEVLVYYQNVNQPRKFAFFA